MLCMRKRTQTQKLYFTRITHRLRQADRQRQADRDRQTNRDRQTDRQTDTQRENVHCVVLCFCFVFCCSVCVSFRRESFYCPCHVSARVLSVSLYCKVTFWRLIVSVTGSLACTVYLIRLSVSQHCHIYSTQFGNKTTTALPDKLSQHW